MLPPAMLITLIHIQGGMKGEIQEFLDSVITIGRLPSLTLHFPSDEPGVSRTHAKIEREGNQFKLYDLSKFGTFVNGKQVKEVYLKNGDVLEFGPGGPKVSFQSEVYNGTPPPAKDLKLEPPPAPFQRSVPSAQNLPPVSSPVVEQKLYDVSPPKVVASLIIQYGPTIREFRELPVVIGTSDRSDFLLSHEGILPQHAQIFFLQGSYLIKDMTGQRLIKVNHLPIGIETELKAEDEIEFSPLGPFFKFLGDGRLAELDLPIAMSSPQTERNGERERFESQSGKEDSPIGNIFSRLFKRNK